MHDTAHRPQTVKMARTCVVYLTPLHTAGWLAGMRPSVLMSSCVKDWMTARPYSNVLHITPPAGNSVATLVAEYGGKKLWSIPPLLTWSYEMVLVVTRPES